METGMKMWKAIGALARYREGVRPVMKAIAEAEEHEHADRRTLRVEVGLRDEELDEECPRLNFWKCIRLIDTDPARFQREAAAMLLQIRQKN